MPVTATRAPTFMIIGGFKCGTTALYQYLRSHPQVFLPDEKEPHYYAEDVGDHRIATTPQEYRKLYSGVGSQHFAIGDASASYLHSTVALPRIAQELPATKLIVMLRQPVDMVVSMHSDMVWICFEDEPDFERTWALQDQRRAGAGLSPLCQVPWFLQYRELGRLARHTRRLLNLFPREQIRFFLMDDLKDSPARVYQEALTFLGLSSDGRSEFPRVNASKRNRFQSLAWLQSALVQSLPEPCVRAGKFVGLGKVNRAIMSANCAPHRPRPLATPFRQHLIDEFREDICDLEDVLGRNLDHWKN